MLNIIVPVYKNESNIAELLPHLKRIVDQIPVTTEVVFVIDGSPDLSYALLKKKLPEQTYASRIVVLSKNFGSFAAIRAGMAYCKGQWMVVMAADLQEPPELIVDMAHILLKNQHDVVVATRALRKDSWLERFFSYMFWSFYRFFINKNIPQGGVDVFGCNALFRENLFLLNEQRSSLIAQIFWMGYERCCIEYIRQKRTSGKSGWTFSKKHGTYEKRNLKTSRIFVK